MKPYHFLNMFLTFRHLKPYVLTWFALIKKRVYSDNGKLIWNATEVVIEAVNLRQ